MTDHQTSTAAQTPAGGSPAASTSGSPAASTAASTAVSTARPTEATPAARESRHSDDGGTPDDRRPRGVAARSLAEGAGAFLVILAGVGATITVSDTALQPTLVFGFAVVAAMIAFGYVSGGHFNPAITVGSVVAGRTAVVDGVVYVVAQVVGALAATALTWLVLSANPQLTDIGNFFSAASNGYGEHSPIRFPLSSAFLLEVVATALLVAVFLGAGSARARRDLAPFAVGLTYTGLLTFLLPVTNGGLNPARSTASAVFAEAWALEQLWLFWAAPVVGALIAGLAYRVIDAAGAAGSPVQDAPAGHEAAPDAQSAPARQAAVTAAVAPMDPSLGSAPARSAPADAASADRSESSRDGHSTETPSPTDSGRRDDAASFFGASSDGSGADGDPTTPGAADDREEYEGPQR